MRGPIRHQHTKCQQKRAMIGWVIGDTTHFSGPYRDPNEPMNVPSLFSFVRLPCPPSYPSNAAGGSRREERCKPHHGVGGRAQLQRYFGDILRPVYINVYGVCLEGFRRHCSGHRFANGNKFLDHIFIFSKVHKNDQYRVQKTQHINYANEIELQVNFSTNFSCFIIMYCTG